MRVNKKGQSFSTDVIIVVIILLFAGLFLVMTTISDVSDDSSNSGVTYEEASAKADIVFENLKNENIVGVNNEVDVEKLLSMDEEAIREKLNIQGEFCIAFEKDGNLVKIDPDNNVNGIGSSNIQINDVPCK